MISLEEKIQVRSVEFPVQGFQFLLDDVIIDNPSQNANPLYDAGGIAFQQSGVLDQEDGFRIIGFPIADSGFIPNSEELLPFFEINVGAKGKCSGAGALVSVTARDRERERKGERVHALTLYKICPFACLFASSHQ